MYADKDTNRIILGGFGQGCSLISATFLSLPGTTPYGGVICIAGLNPLAVIPTPKNPSLKKMKYFIFAGKKDERVWYSDTKRTINQRLDSIVYKRGFIQNKAFYTTNASHEIT
jgi:predicted esterase